MSYRLRPGTPISEEIRRAGAGQVSIILSRLTARASQGSAVHDARRAVKRLRALATLIRPAIGKAAHAGLQDRLRAIARPLSGLRDVQAMRGTIASLEQYDPAIGGGPVAAALRKLLETREQAAGEHVESNATRQARRIAREVQKAIAGLPLDGAGFETVAGGLRGNYRKARKAFSRAYRAGTGEAFHEWRKLVQRHWRHLQLLGGASPKRIRPLIRLARELSENLGNDHDLEVLRDLVRTERANLGRAEDVKAYLALCRRRQTELRDEARRRGKKLFRLKPRAFAARIRRRWERAEARTGRQTAE